MQHGELVLEQGDLGEQRPARAKRVRQGGGGHQDGFENERKGHADALDFSLIAQVAMTGAARDGCSLAHGATLASLVARSRE